MSTIIVYKIKKRLVKSGKDMVYKPSVFSQLGKNFFLTRQLFFPNWGKIIARLAAFTSFEKIHSVRIFLP